MFSQCVLVPLIFTTVYSLPPFQRSFPSISTSLKKEDLQDPSPWIRFSHFGHSLTQFPKLLSDISEAGPKIELDSKKFQVIVNVKDYKKENLRVQINGDFINIQGLNFDKRSSLISEFSQVYSFPLKANPSSVTAVLTSDDYLVISAPLGSQPRRNKIEKLIPIFDSKETLQTQNAVNKSSDVTILPLFKLVKNQQSDSIIEVSQNNEDGEKIPENEVISSTLTPEQNTSEKLLSAPNVLSTQKPELVKSIQEDNKIDNAVLHSEKEIETVMNEVTLSTQQLFTASNNTAEGFQREKTTQYITNEVNVNLQQMTSQAQASLEMRAVPTVLKASETVDSLDSLSTVSLPMERINNEENSDVASQELKLTEMTGKYMELINEVSTLAPSQELYTNQKSDTLFESSDDLMEKEMIITLKSLIPFTMNQVPIATDPLQVKAKQTQEQLKDQIIEHSNVNTGNISLLEQSHFIQEEINESSTSISVTAPMSIIEIFSTTSSEIMANVETRDENSEIVKDIVVTNAFFITTTDQPDISLKSSMVLQEEHQNNEEILSKCDSITEQSLPLVIEESATSETDTALLPINPDKLQNVESSIEGGKIDSTLKLSLTNTTDQPVISEITATIFVQNNATNAELESVTKQSLPVVTSTTDISETNLAVTSIVQNNIPNAKVSEDTFEIRKLDSTTELFLSNSTDKSVNSDTKATSSHIIQSNIQNSEITTSYVETGKVDSITEQSLLITTNEPSIASE